MTLLLAYALLLLVHVVGLALNLIGLPGIWLIPLAHAVFGWWSGWDVYVGWPSVVALLTLGVAAEVVEFAAGAAGGGVAGGGKRSMLGAIVGGIVGAIALTFLLPIPVVGSVVGAVAGAGAGAGLLELTRRPPTPFTTRLESWRHAGRVGYGAAWGRFWGTIFKSGFGVVMLIVSAVAALPR